MGSRYPTESNLSHRDRASLFSNHTPSVSGRNTPYNHDASQAAGQRFADDLEGQNDEALDGLSAKVKLLKNLTVEIGNEVRSSTTQLSQMNDVFAETGGILSGTFRRMNTMASRQGGRHFFNPCYVQGHVQDPCFLLRKVMPELPEVERATRLIANVATGRVIERVETTPDTIVYSGVTNEEFAAELTGRTVSGAGRRGKLFFVELEPHEDGRKRMPVLHLGMTGMLQLRGQEAVYYRVKPSQSASDWPPKFMKFILRIAATEAEPAAELAFLDPRRLGRIRLCESPLTEPPISELGFDPILSMITLELFMTQVKKRKTSIKALLLDQSFSAGVGNWIADEVLYHSRVHPEQKTNTLSEEQLTNLHQNIVYVCQTAVDVNADASKFPQHWLFRHRWGKGRKGKGKGQMSEPLLLPSGSPAVIKWITVGGRTSAYVPVLQKLTSDGSTETAGAIPDEDDDSSALSSAPEDEAEAKKKKTPAKRKRAPSPGASTPRKKSEVQKRPSRKGRSLKSEHWE